MHAVTDLQKRRREKCVPIAANPSTAFERHFTAAELGEIWRYDTSTIIRMFQDEPGVLKKGRENRRDGKRDYVTLRIPESVALRVYALRSK
jgi:hypothetical protein